MLRAHRGTHYFDYVGHSSPHCVRWLCSRGDLAAYCSVLRCEYWGRKTREKQEFNNTAKNKNYQSCISCMCICWTLFGLGSPVAGAFFECIGSEYVLSNFCSFWVSFFKYSRMTMCANLANENADTRRQFNSLGTLLTPESRGEGLQEGRSSHAHEDGSLLDAATGLTMPEPFARANDDEGRPENPTPSTQ